jgi:alpha-galactosidase
MMKPVFSTVTRPEDMRQCRSWTEDWLARPESLPFSFTYHEKRIEGIPAEWGPITHWRRIDANITELTYEGRDPLSGLVVRCEAQIYQDFPVIEWVVWLTNTSDTPTPLIDNLLALDGVFSGGTPLVYHCNGDFYSEDGYTPQETPLPVGERLLYAPTGGRSCDGAFPYYRIQFEGCGLTLAIGWPAQWSVAFHGVPGGVHITAGQEKTHLKLMRGESIRTPRITLLSWTGETPRAVNLWRRWYLQHILPRPDGQPLAPKLACAATDIGEEFTNATEENQLRFQAKFQEAGLNFDVWWIDAGWYPCRNEQGERRWWRTGDWRPDAERFPHGFGPVAQAAAKYGADLLLWHEPERVHVGSQLDREHPEWLFKTKEIPGDNPDVNRLLNLGNPACRTWLTHHINQLIAENGIRIYRQDFNFPPLQYWRDNETEDRQGINENFHIQGYLQFWDDLLSQHPGLWIDSCSSGGRRNDLETMRRSVPLHYSDYGYGIHPVKLAFHHTLYAWIPYFKECTLSWDICQPEDDMRFDKLVDRFSFHCGMASMLFATLDIHRGDYDFALAGELIALWRRAAETMLHGDYYPLTPFSKSPEAWVVWQFDQPEYGKGLIQGIRLADCPLECIPVHPQAFLPGRRYRFENPELGEIQEVAGDTLLQDGFTLQLPARSGGIWFYNLISE